MILRFGLVGKKLSHSFSKKYFTEKFEKEKLNYSYDLFELETIDEFKSKVLTIENLSGLNVTLPYKEQIIPFLDDMDAQAAKIGAINVIKVSKEKKTKGYNTDVVGFKKSFTETALKHSFELSQSKALILGTGGAAKAVHAVLKDLKIPFASVSREASKADYSYEELKLNPRLFSDYTILINTTPLGMYPNVDAAPDIDFTCLGTSHYIYDLIYNPTETLLMKKARAKGALVQCGLDMLYYQAEAAWEIWNTPML